MKFIFDFILKEQLLDCISSARDLIRTKLTDPQSLPGDKKMIDLIDERINQKQSKLFCILNEVDNVRKCYSSGFFVKLFKQLKLRAILMAMFTC